MPNFTSMFSLPRRTKKVKDSSDSLGKVTVVEGLQDVNLPLATDQARQYIFEKKHLDPLGETTTFPDEANAGHKNPFSQSETDLHHIKTRRTASERITTTRRPDLWTLAEKREQTRARIS